MRRCNYFQFFRFGFSPPHLDKPGLGQGFKGYNYSLRTIGPVSSKSRMPEPIVPSFHLRNEVELNSTYHSLAGSASSRFGWCRSWYLLPEPIFAARYTPITLTRYQDHKSLVNHIQMKYIYKFISLKRLLNYFLGWVVQRSRFPVKEPNHHILEKFRIHSGGKAILPNEWKRSAR